MSLGTDRNCRKKVDFLTFVQVRVTYKLYVPDSCLLVIYSIRICIHVSTCIREMCIGVCVYVYTNA